MEEENYLSINERLGDIIFEVLEYYDDDRAKLIKN